MFEQRMLQEFQQAITSYTTSVGDMLMALAVAAVCGFAISMTYRWTYRGSDYAPSFVRSMVFLAMITAIVMLVIGNNLARAFGLVGAMSIIRFRTAVKDPQDIVFIFFALATGMAAGVGMHTIALLGTACICLVIAVTTQSDFAVIYKESFVLQFSYHAPQQNGEASYIPILEKYARSYKLINTRAVGTGDELDLTFFVDLREKQLSETMTQELSQAKHVSNVNLFYDTEQM